jgi:hypothetical protein
MQTPSVASDSQRLPTIILVASKMDKCQLMTRIMGKWQKLVAKLQDQFNGKLYIDTTVHNVDCRQPNAALCQRLGEIRQQILTAHPVRVPQLVFEMDKRLQQSSRYVARKARHCHVFCSIHASHLYCSVGIYVSFSGKLDLPPPFFL